MKDYRDSLPITTPFQAHEAHERRDFAGDGVVKPRHEMIGPGGSGSVCGLVGSLTCALFLFSTLLPDAPYISGISPTH